jgi:hypothetical protein
MVNFKKILIIISLALVSTIVFAGCVGDSSPVQLSTPEATVITNNNRLLLMTTDYPNASSYNYGIYSGPNSNNLDLYIEQNSSNNYFDVTSFVTQSNVYYFYIQALGNNDKYLDSNISSIVSYDNSDNLPSPILELTDTTLSWTTVLNNEGYRVFKNSSLITTTQNTTYSIASQINAPTPFEFEVQAIGSTGTQTYLDSLKSNIVTYTDHLVLDAPQNIQVNENTEYYLTWDEVTNASGYTVVVDFENDYTTSTNELLLTDILTTAKQYNFTVKANASADLIDSEFSNVYSYDNYIQLQTPVITPASRNGSDVVVGWEQISNAQSYTLIVNGNPLLDSNDNVAVIYDNQVLIPGELEKQEGGFDLQVYANDYSYYLESETSSVYEYSGIDVLIEPTNLNVNYDTATNVVELSWDEVSGANGYSIAIDNNIIAQTTQTIFQLQSYLTNNEVAQLKVQAKGQGFTADSNFSEPTVFNYTTNTVPGYTNDYFYYFDYYDYNITSQEELNALFAYAISYHIQEITAYIDYNLTQQQLLQADAEGDNNGEATEEEIINYKQSLALLAYTETHSLSYYYPTQTGLSNKEYKFEFDYPYNINPTLTSSDPDLYVQNTNYQPFESNIGRDENYNDFASEKALLEVPVYSSENLFMAVNSGAKPIFMTDNSQAELVYETAKDVLRQIIDDNMSEYEKVLAIHDYVVYNTVYDRYVYSLATNEEDNTLLPEYSVFYLEGVLLDGVAVCDGIAKTVAMLANMEGIEAVKINGEAGTTSTIGHAWNKVYIEINGEYNWFVIDATWDMTAVSQPSSGDEPAKEILVHDYFLITDADIQDTHIASSTFNPVANTEYNHYDYFEYTSGYDYYIENQTELDHLVNYLLTNSYEGVIIYVDPAFNFNLANKFSSAIQSSNVSILNHELYSYTDRVTSNTINFINFIYS